MPLDTFPALVMSVYHRNGVAAKPTWIWRPFHSRKEGNEEREDIGKRWIEEKEIGYGAGRGKEDSHPLVASSSQSPRSATECLQDRIRVMHVG